MINEMTYETQFGKIIRHSEETLFRMYCEAREQEHFLTDYPGLTGDWDYDRLRWEILHVRKELAKLRGNMN